MSTAAWYPRQVVAVAVLMLASLAALAAPAAAQQAGSGRSLVVGTVTDATTGAPIPRAIVEAQPGSHRALTDSLGRFRLVVEKGMGSAMIQRIGYDRAVVPWEVEADTVELEVTLQPATVMLAELRVELDRLDRVVQGTAPYAVQRINESALARSTASDALEAIQDRFGTFKPTGCSAVSATGGACRRVRGTPTRICAVVDETPVLGGYEGLRRFHPSDLGRVYVIGGGRAVIGYTRWYLEDAKRQGRWRPLSVNQQLAMFCRG